MAPTPAVYIAYTGEINGPGLTPVLTRAQVWAGLEIKVEYAQDFVPVILSTDVISRDIDDYGRRVTVREVLFKEGNRRVKEEVILYEPTKIVFNQPDGSRIQNVISTDSTGAMHMTYDFEWLHKGMNEEDLEHQKEKYAKLSKIAVESSIQAIREMVKSGRIPS